MDLVTVFETTDVMEAELLKSRLDAAGIHCLITRENDPMSGAFPTRLQVGESDVDAAKELINEDLSKDE